MQVREWSVLTARRLCFWPVSCPRCYAAALLLLSPCTQGGTYGGNAVACAAASATIDVINDERLADNAAARGAQLMQGKWEEGQQE